MPQEARLRCRLQEPRGGLASAFEQRRLKKRSRERRACEVRDLCHLRMRYFRVRRIAANPLPSCDTVRGLGDVGTDADSRVPKHPVLGVAIPRSTNRWR
jgi:hypothetical protein